MIVWVDMKCEKCGQIYFDVENNYQYCPKCGSELKRVYTAPGISFKGEGFYCNDKEKKK